MQKNIVQLSRVLFALAALVIAVVVAVKVLQPGQIDCRDTQEFTAQRFQLDNGFQTSTSYLFKLAKWNACNAPGDADAQQRYQLATDINIKARSYAAINKASFWVSLLFMLTIFAIPIAYAAREAAEADPGPKKMTYATILWKMLSPMQIPALAMAAGLSFTLYENYKEKQSQAESLMRYVLFAEPGDEKLAETVIDTLAVIDTGFSFTSFLSSSLSDAASTDTPE
jgi:hypothetical protein